MSDLSPESARRLGRAAAVCYLTTWITSVAAVPLYGGSTFDPGAAPAGRLSVLAASLLEIILAIAVVGTAMALYPLLRRHGVGSALGYVALRTVEAAVILVGVVTMLPVVARPATPAASALSPDVAAGLHLLHDWTFLVGPGLINPANAVVLAALLWRTRLVPRFVPTLGLIGSAIVATMNLLVMFGRIEVMPALASPLFLWEISLAAILAIRGLRTPAMGIA